MAMACYKVKLRLLRLKIYFRWFLKDFFSFKAGFLNLAVKERLEHSWKLKGNVTLSLFNFQIFKKSTLTPTSTHAPGLTTGFSTISFLISCDSCNNNKFISTAGHCASIWLIYWHYPLFPSTLPQLSILAITSLLHRMQLQVIRLSCISTGSLVTVSIAATKTIQAPPPTKLHL